MAKPVGVTYVEHGDENSGLLFAGILVVCEDGAVWTQQDLGELGVGGWHEVAAVPNTPREEEKLREDKAREEEWHQKQQHEQETTEEQKEEARHRR